MNRNVMIGGIAAVVLLLGVAGYLIFSGRQSTTPSDRAGLEDQGPVSLNPVTVITEHTANQSEDGHRLNLGFSNFELVTKSNQTASAVFSTTWRLKVGPDERVVVAAATLNGYMKSTGTPAPAPVAAPAASPAPATDAAAPATAPAATPAEQPSQPATPAPATPVAGDGVARIIVALGGETTVTEWRDVAGTGSDRKLSKAISFSAGSADMRDGGTIPVTVTVELSGGASAETLAKLNGLDLQLFVENAPLPAPVADTTPVTPPPATDGSTPASPPPADAGTTPTPPPADTGTTTPPTP